MSGGRYAREIDTCFFEDAINCRAHVLASEVDTTSFQRRISRCRRSSIIVRKEILQNLSELMFVFRRSCLPNGDRKAAIQYLIVKFPHVIERVDRS